MKELTKKSVGRAPVTYDPGTDERCKRYSLPRINLSPFAAIHSLSSGDMDFPSLAQSWQLDWNDND
jgi:hypothetical protein